ncbi:MAG: anti-sigma F factor antagonist [Clostridia bacterium]|nr:anti-sigma F factor antagonist [Clostridia bacterium]
MDIKLQMKGRTLIAALSGELDHHSAKTVKDMLETAIVNKSAQNMVFDLTNLTFMDSSGIGLMIGRYKLITSIGGKVCIVSKSKTLNRLISMSGVTKLMDIYQSTDDAVKSVGGM